MLPPARNPQSVGVRTPPTSPNGLVEAFARAYTLSEIFPMHHSTVRDAIADLVGLPEGAYPLVADVSRFGLVVDDEHVADPHGHLRELAQSLHGAGVTQFGIPRGLTLYEAEDFLISLRRVAEAGDVSLQETLATGRGTPVGLSFHGGPLEAVPSESPETEPGARDELDGVQAIEAAQEFDEAQGSDGVRESDQAISPESARPDAQDQAPDSGSISDPDSVEALPADLAVSQPAAEHAPMEHPVAEDSLTEDSPAEDSLIEHSPAEDPETEDWAAEAVIDDEWIVEAEPDARNAEGPTAGERWVEPRAVQEWVAAGGGVEPEPVEHSTTELSLPEPSDGQDQPLERLSPDFSVVQDPTMDGAKREGAADKGSIVGDDVVDREVATVGEDPVGDASVGADTVDGDHEPDLPAEDPVEWWQPEADEADAAWHATTGVSDATAPAAEMAGETVPATDTTTEAPTDLAVDMAVDSSPDAAARAEDIVGLGDLAASEYPESPEEFAGSEDVAPSEELAGSEVLDPEDHEQIQSFRAALEEGRHDDSIGTVGSVPDQKAIDVEDRRASGWYPDDPATGQVADEEERLFAEEAETHSVPIGDLAPDLVPDLAPDRHAPAAAGTVGVVTPVAAESTESTPEFGTDDDAVHIVEDAELYVRSSDVERTAINQSILEAAARLRALARPDAVAEAVDRLISGSDPSEPAPNALAHSLCEPDVVDALVARLGAIRTIEDREEVLYTFQRLSDILAPALARALSQVPARSTRRNYMDALFTMGDDAVRVSVPMLEDSRWFIVRNGVDVLGEAGFADSVGTLTPTLSHPDARVRRAAVMAMAKLGGEEAGLELLPTLEDPSQDVRGAAAMAVGHLQVMRALRPLLAMLDQEKEDDFQQVILRSLGQLKDPGAVPQIEKRATVGLFSKPSRSVRIAAYRALAAIGTPHARQLVLAAVQDRDSDVATVARALASQLS